MKVDDLVKWNKNLINNSPIVTVGQSGALCHNFDTLRKKINRGPIVRIRNNNNASNFTNIKFSKSGNYLIVFYRTKFDVFGGDRLEFVASFQHFRVKDVEFSIDEKYLISYNGTS